MKNIIQFYFKGVSWRNPIIILILFLLDPVDWLLRFLTGRQMLPKYSIRVRSNGMRNQLGGGKFYREGLYICSLLELHAGLSFESRVCEIGCGCGRQAIPLAKLLGKGKYKGFDIEEKSLNFCRSSEYLSRKKFSFEFIDVYNQEYNPNGKIKASEYVFPVDGCSGDVVFLISVFTHMLPQDIVRYAEEISRMLVPGGRCLFTSFLVDYGIGDDLSFKFQCGDAYVQRRDFPEIAVGYKTSFFVNSFARFGLFLTREPLLGTWRGKKDTSAHTKFSQDILVFEKKSSYASAN